MQIYDTLEAIPQEDKHFYKELDGKWHPLAASELKTVEDIVRIQDALKKERSDHADVKKKLALFGTLDADETLAKLDRIDELESANGGKLDEVKINELVETRIKSRLSPLERQIVTLTTERDEQTGFVEEYKVKDTKRLIHDQIRKAGIAAKIRETAIDDAMLMGEHIFTVDESGRVVTRDNVGATPFIDPAVWLTEVKKTRPHWWPDSVGAGAKGSDGRNIGGSNPFSADGWNVTEQGTMLKENRGVAEQMAKSAGTTIGGGRPK